jgi:hypothetical protein
MTYRIKAVVVCVLAITAAVAAVGFPGQAYHKHLCGIYGTKLDRQESCPGISPPRHWKRAVGYHLRKGIDACVVVKNRRNKPLFGRCSSKATSIYVRPRDLDGGRHYTRLYMKNNNVALNLDDKFYLYADTK